MHHLHFNLLALFASACMLWFLGALWYSPVLFAKPWMAMIAVPEEGKKQKMLSGMISSFFGDLVLSFVLAHFVLWARAENFAHGAFIGFLAWFGFIASPLFPQGIYEGRPTRLFWINAGYWLVGLLLAGGLLAVWR
ncbi:MAG: DUF1761 domain-containing protein [Terracidiphilus sp.]